MVKEYTSMTRWFAKFCLPNQVDCFVKEVQKHIFYPRLSYATLMARITQCKSSLQL